MNLGINSLYLKSIAKQNIQYFTTQSPVQINASGFFLNG